MLYTVKEVAELTGVTIKALHHNRKIGLLRPCEITDAGYRLYGQNELELLQCGNFSFSKDSSNKIVLVSYFSESSNFTGMFDEVNIKVEEIAGQVCQTQRGGTSIII